MKKLLLIVFVLAICVLAFPQGVMAAAPVPITIDAVYGATTTFDVDLNAPSGGGGDWDLIAGQNNQRDNALTFTVNTLDDWTVEGTDTSVWDGHNAGFMQGDKGDLQTPMGIYVVGETSSWKDFRAPVQIRNGGSSSLPQTWSNTINQPVTTSDYGSPNGYHIVITFTCATIF